jgi:hypothetical protein
LFEGFYETIHDIALEQFYEVDPSSLEWIINKEEYAEQIQGMTDYEKKVFLQKTKEDAFDKITSEMWQFAREIYWELYFVEFMKKYWKMLAEKWISVEYERLFSPKEYNYWNDKIYIQVSWIDDDDFDALFNFDESILEKDRIELFYKTSEGFCSSNFSSEYKPKTVSYSFAKEITQDWVLKQQFKAIYKDGTESTKII